MWAENPRQLPPLPVTNSDLKRGNAERWARQRRRTCEEQQHGLQVAEREIQARENPRTKHAKEAFGREETQGRV